MGHIVIVLSGKVGGVYILVLLAKVRRIAHMRGGV